MVLDHSDPTGKAAMSHWLVDGLSGVALETGEELILIRLPVGPADHDGLAPGAVDPASVLAPEVTPGEAAASAESALLKTTYRRRRFFPTVSGWRAEPVHRKFHVFKPAGALGRRRLAPADPYEVRGA
jgi:hypothetical protein